MSFFTYEMFPNYKALIVLKNIYIFILVSLSLHILIIFAFTRPIEKNWKKCWIFFIPADIFVVFKSVFNKKKSKLQRPNIRNKNFVLIIQVSQNGLNGVHAKMLNE